MITLDFRSDISRLASLLFSVTTHVLLATCGLGLFPSSASAQAPLRDSLHETVTQAELKTVKLYGAGGLGGLDAYQSGFFVSESGHIVTVWSTVLDVEEVLVVSSDGSRYVAKVLGIDPNLEIAVLQTEEPPSRHFSLGEATKALPGTRVLALSNLFGIATGTEKSSVQQGVVMAVTDLKAGRGFSESVYKGNVYVIDAMTNNPGAAGGALTDLKGRLIGMLGKELRDKRANIWLNYAIPISEIKPSIERLISGENIERSKDNRETADQPATLASLGVILVPDVLSKTPAYVDLVQPESLAEKAGLQRDDLILFVNTTRITSQKSLRNELQYIDRADEFAVLVQRGAELKEILIRP